MRAGEVARTNLMWRNTNTSAGTPAVGDTLSVAPVEGRPWQPVELTGATRTACTSTSAARA
ncbi:hypothetical protein ACFSVJ_17335 [Prauserella oleivorans]